MNKLATFALTAAFSASSLAASNYPDYTIIDVEPMAQELHGHLKTCRYAHSKCVMPQYHTFTILYKVTYICKNGTQYCVDLMVPEHDLEHKYN
jgi:hypothetical protein